MNYYDSNIELIKKYRKELYQGLEAISLENNITQIDKIEEKKAKDGNIIFYIEKNAIEYRLNSSYDPVNEAEIWAMQYNFNHLYKVISVFGLGNTMFVRQIVYKMNKEDLLLIYEPSIDIFLKTLELYDLTDIIKNDRIQLSVVGLNEKQFANALRDNVEWLNLYSQIICCLPKYEQIFEEDYRDFLRVIRDNNNRAVVNRNTEAFLGEANTSNVISNLQYIKESNMASDLSHLLPLDIPVFIVAAGPSLDKNVQQLKKAKGKSIIIAVDTAINRLLANDIIPDFTITLDPIKPTKCYMDERANEVPIFYHMPSNHDIMSKHQGRKFNYGNNIYLGALLREYDKKACFNATGGSVTTAAFSVCIAIGFKRIIMVGLDLAFSGKVTHAGGIQASEQQLNQEMIMVEDINGDMIPAPWNFYTFLMWLNDAIDVCKDTEVIDATEGGAKVKGSIIMTLEEAIQAYCTKEINVAELIEDLEPTFNEKEIKKLYEYLQESIFDLEQMVIKSNQVIKNAEKLVKLEKSHSDDVDRKASLIRKISKVEKWLEKRMVYQLLEPHIAKELAKVLRQISHIHDDIDEKEENLEIYDKVIATYSTILKGAKEIKPLLEELLTER